LSRYAFTMVEGKEWAKKGEKKREG
jgi:hypothetical protein